jgi:hypothetical protein
MLKFPINQAGQLLSKAALGVQAAHRIHQFLERERVTSNEADAGMFCEDDDNVVLRVEKGSFYVGALENESLSKTDEVKAAFTLSGINIELRRGEVLAGKKYLHICYCSRIYVSHLKPPAPSCRASSKW